MLNTDGFIHIKNLFKKQDIINVKSQMIDCFEFIANTKYSNDTDIIKFFNTDFNTYLRWVNLCQNLAIFQYLACNQTVIDCLKNNGVKVPVYNMKPNLLFSNKNIAKHEVNWKIPSHQDWPSTRGSLNGVTMWVPFVDITQSIGPLEVARGTHKLGPLKFTTFGGGLVIDQNTDQYKYEPIIMGIGDVLIFNYFTIHRSGENITEDTIRWSAQFRYDDAAEQTYIERKYPRYKKEVRLDEEFDNNFPSQTQIINTFK